MSHDHKSTSKSATPNPTSISKEVASKLTEANIDNIKRLRCVAYNKCLDIAVANDWAGFSCNKCTVFALPDFEQMVSDVLALKVCWQASEYILEDGSPSRQRGAKPGQPRVRKTQPDPVIIHVEIESDHDNQ